ncbi:3'-5' exonuclease [Micromonospora echinospora]
MREDVRVAGHGSSNGGAPHVRGEDRTPRAGARHVAHRPWPSTPCPTRQRGSTSPHPPESGDAVIEIAVIDAHTGAALLDTLVNPGMPIQPGAQAIHGITGDDVADAPR